VPQKLPQKKQVAFDLTIPATVLLLRLARTNQMTWSADAGFRVMLTLLLV
jgi:hypothetical protein